MPPKFDLTRRAHEILEQIQRENLLKKAISLGLISSPSVTLADEKEVKEHLVDDILVKLLQYKKDSDADQTVGKSKILAIDSGSFQTNYNPGSESSRMIDLAAPKIAFGLTLLDMHSDRNAPPLHFKISVDEIIGNRFKIHFHDNSTKPLLHSGEASWLSVSRGDRLLQVGHYSTLQDQLSAHGGRYQFDRKITFDRTYLNVPKVIVWLCGLHMARSEDSDHSYCMEVKAIWVTTSGFRLALDAMDRATLWSADVCWIAHPQNAPGITSGHFQTEETRGSHFSCSDNIIFPRPFDRPPRVITCINRLDFLVDQNIRLEVKTDITRLGMTWNLRTWDNSQMLGAGAAYIAIDQNYPDLEDLHPTSANDELERGAMTEASS